MLIFIEEAVAINTADCAFVSNDDSVNPDNVIDVSNDNIGINFSGSNEGKGVGLNEVKDVGLNVGFKKGWIEKLIILL